MSLILALDFGGTKLAAAIAHANSQQWLSYERCLSPANANASTDLEIMRSLIHCLLQEVKPTAIGVSFGGPVDANTGTVKLSHHVSGWENIPLQKLLADEYGVSVSVDNDANVAALGEYRYGAGVGYDSLFYITVSTGVGGGWILNGKPWRGANGMAGEIGHIVVDPAGPICLCGKRGCVERLASGPYMALDVREWLETRVRGDRETRVRGDRETRVRGDGETRGRGDGETRGRGDGETWGRGDGETWGRGDGETRGCGDGETWGRGDGETWGRGDGEILRGLVEGNLELITGKIVSEAAMQGDELAQDILHRSAWALGVGIGNVANLINPQRFVLGGSVTKAGEGFWRVIRQVARETALPEINFEVVPAGLGDDAPLWGAVALALDTL
ncbi:ROK family transcriptional regulator [Hapalosiphon sp. MRB220]|nr:ROK family transcriptional regulator [Hapalosiphon sp. MRB220]